MSIFSGKKITIDRKEESYNDSFRAKTVNYVVRLKEHEDGAADDAAENGADDEDGAKDGVGDGSDDAVGDVDKTKNKNVNNWMHDAFQEILDFGVRNAEAHHFIGITMCSTLVIVWKFQCK